MRRVCKSLLHAATKAADMKAACTGAYESQCVNVLLKQVMMYLHAADLQPTKATTLHHGNPGKSVNALAATPVDEFLAWTQT